MYRGRNKYAKLFVRHHGIFSLSQALGTVFTGLHCIVINMPEINLAPAASSKSVTSLLQDMCNVGQIHVQLKRGLSKSRLQTGSPSEIVGGRKLTPLICMQLILQWHVT